MTEEELLKRLEEAGEDVGGFFNPGNDRYAGEWDMDLDLSKSECPDLTPDFGKYEVSGTFVVGDAHKRTGRMRASTLRYQKIGTAKELNQMRESAGYSERQMREWNWAPDPFSYGTDQSVPGVGGANAQYLPLWPGPFTRQLYWQDYFAMSAKAFEAYNHDPVSWRCVHMKQEFALGKGLQARVTYSSGGNEGKTHDAAVTVWKEFWKRNKMGARLDMFARDISIYGEQFMRYFGGKGTGSKLLTVRSLDPATIYDLITDPEDMETVFAYHQQFQTAMQMWAPGAATPPTGVQAPTGATQPGSATRFIIRQILPSEIDHYRINTGAYERRGRSDLFPALGWIKRLRDYLTSHVIRADMLSRICWDLEVQGNTGAIQALRGLLFPNGQAPPPGSVFGHNKASSLSVLAPESSGSTGGRYDPILDSLVTLIGNSIGLPKDWLGFGMATTRASALVATEPAARSLEELQGTLEQVLHDMFDRVMAQAKITDADVEFTFPSIATEDRSALLNDLSFAEANQWVSKQTSASIAAKNLGISGYDYETEQGLIASEFDHAADPDVDDPDADPNPVTGEPGKKAQQGDGVIRRPMIIATNRQAAKLDPTKSFKQEDDPPGMLMPAAPAPAGAAPGGSGGGPAAPKQPDTPPGDDTGGTAPSGGAVGGRGGAGDPSSRNGFPASENPMAGAGASNIKSDMGESASLEDQVALLMRERERQRRVPDPELVGDYRESSVKNLKELVQGAVQSV